VGECSGTLMIHSDGSVAACTEELEGLPCAGTDTPHSGGLVTCDDMLGAGGCEQCALDAWSDREWRHAAHLAAFRRGMRRCPVHVNSPVVAGPARGEVRPLWMHSPVG